MSSVPPVDPAEIEALPLEQRASAFAALLDGLRTDLESDGRD